MARELVLYCDESDSSGKHFANFYGGAMVESIHLAEVAGRLAACKQALDLVLGAMQFRLNDKHKEKPEGSHRRGKRTIAKEQVYKHILAEIRAIYGGKAFNVGTSTGRPNGMRHLWHDPYRHWLFKPANAAVRPEFAKKQKTK